MIASLQGVLQSIAEGEIVVETGGVGFRLMVPVSVLERAPKVGQVISLHTYLVVREDLLALYGFSDPEQRELFTLLLGVTGVGPRLALAVISHLPLDALKSAIVSDQPERLVQVPGIGRKTAEKIIIDLKDRLEAPLVLAEPPSAVDTEVLGALTALGYSLGEAQAALQSVPADAPEDLEERLRLALRSLGGS
ncbi:MAG TPA: Holliday junction branch migration protein RuvA [Anaerolineae bacterium]|nr:Holliday junction branch migration protein RuvA [Anaerolineae bacterium]